MPIDDALKEKFTKKVESTKIGTVIKNIKSKPEPKSKPKQPKPKPKSKPKKVTKPKIDTDKLEKAKEGFKEVVSTLPKPVQPITIKEPEPPKPKTPTSGPKPASEPKPDIEQAKEGFEEFVIKSPVTSKIVDIAQKETPGKKKETFVEKHMKAKEETLPPLGNIAARPSNEPPKPDIFKNENITIRPDQSIYIEYETSAGDIKKVVWKASHFEKNQGDLISQGSRVIRAKTGNDELILEAPTSKEWQKTMMDYYLDEYKSNKYIPTDIKTQIKSQVPPEVKRLGMEKEFIDTAYRQFLGIADEGLYPDIGVTSEAVFNVKLQKKYEKLPEVEQFKYQMDFGDMASVPMSEWKYYPGGSEYMKARKESMIDKYIESGEVGTLRTDPSKLTSARGIGGIYAGAGPQVDVDVGAIRRQAWDKLTLTPEQHHEKYFYEMPAPVRWASSAAHAGLQALAFPITLPQTVIKFATGGKTLILPDVGEALYKIRPGGPTGIIETGISEGVGAITGKSPGAWERFTKDPISGLFATGGELIGFYGAGKGVSALRKAVTPRITSGVRTIGTKVYQQFPKGWERAFPKLQPLETYIYGKTPTYVPRIYGMRGGTSIMTGTGKVRYLMSETLPTGATRAIRTTLRKTPVKTTGYRSLTSRALSRIQSKAKTSWVGKPTWVQRLKAFSTEKPTSLGRYYRQKLLGQAPSEGISIAEKLHQFKIGAIGKAKTGFKRFTGMEKPVPKYTMVAKEDIIKGYGSATERQQGYLFKRIKTYEKDWGKRYVPEKELIPKKYFGIKEKGPSYYRTPSGHIKGVLSPEGELLIGETRGIIRTSVPSVTKQPRFYKLRDFIASKESRKLARGLPGKGSKRFKQVDSAVITTRRFGTEFGGEAYTGAPTASEIAAAEEGMTTMIHSHWKGTSPYFKGPIKRAPIFPGETTAAMGIARSLAAPIAFAGYGVSRIPNALRFPKTNIRAPSEFFSIKPIRHDMIKPHIGIKTEPRTDVLPSISLTPETKTDIIQRQSIGQTQPPIQGQHQEQLQQQEYDIDTDIEIKTKKKKIPIIFPETEGAKPKHDRKIKHKRIAGYKERTYDVPDIWRATKFKKGKKDVFFKPKGVKF